MILWAHSSGVLIFSPKDAKIERSDAIEISARCARSVGLVTLFREG